MKMCTLTSRLRFGRVEPRRQGDAEAGEGPLHRGHRKHRWEMLTLAGDSPCRPGGLPVVETFVFRQAGAAGCSGFVSHRPDDPVHPVHEPSKLRRHFKQRLDNGPACTCMSSMRTTVEIKDKYRAELLKLAAQRGEKGFSRIIDDALAHYFAMENQGVDRRKAALATRGKLTDAAADSMVERIQELRKSWR